MSEYSVFCLINKLVPLLTKEAKLLGAIHGEVADIKDELESIQSFLKDADARATAEEDMSEGVKTWVKHVRYQNMEQKCEKPGSNHALTEAISSEAAELQNRVKS